MAKQITKSWGIGLPTAEGRFLVCNDDYSGPQIVRAVEVGASVKVFDATGRDMTVTASTRHFGPIPGIDRSLAATKRMAVEAE